jgi:Spy/CpxP family protein refolding chaperone
MKTTRFAALGAAVLIGVGASALHAQTTTPAPQPGASAGQQGGPQDGQRRGDGMRRGGRAGQAGRALFRGIDLSDAQRTQIRTIHEKYATQRKALWTPQRGAEGRRQRPDSATRVQLQGLMERQTAELRGVLTPAQQATFDQNRAQLRERAQARMQGQGRPGRRGPGAR